MARTLLAGLGFSLLLAVIASVLLYQTDEGEPKDMVVAARELPVGVTVKQSDVKVVKAAPSQFPKTGLSKMEEVVDRPVVSTIRKDEPLLESRLAGPDSIVCRLPRMPPAGLRAVSVPLNDVIGDADFVMPGMHVDVLVAAPPRVTKSKSKPDFPLWNILVLTVAHTGDSPSVTLLVTQDQAEMLIPAVNEARIQLKFRNRRSVARRNHIKPGIAADSLVHK